MGNELKKIFDDSIKKANNYYNKVHTETEERHFNKGYMKRFIEGKWLNQQEQLDFLIERIFILEEEIKELLAGGK